MAAEQNIASVARVSGTTMAMPFIGSSNGEVASSWQQCEIAEGRCEVRIENTLSLGMLINLFDFGKEVINYQC